MEKRPQVRACLEVPDHDAVRVPLHGADGVLKRLSLRGGRVLPCSRERARVSDVSGCAITGSWSALAPGSPADSVDSTEPPRRIIADSNDSLVRVEGS